MRTLLGALLLSMVLLGCESNMSKTCTTVVKIGSCTPGDFFNAAACRVELKTGIHINVWAPSMIGDRVCRRGDARWFYEE